MQLNLNLISDDTPSILQGKSQNQIELNNLPMDCVIVDIETTGLNPLQDSIIEISALKVKEGKIIDEFTSLINPEIKIPYFITKLTGITDDDVKDERKSKEVLIDFCNFISFNPIVGHNVKFDLSFINVNLKRHFKRGLSNDFSDTLRFSREAYKELSSHKLGIIAQHLKIDTKGAHRALNDCYMTYKIMLDLYSKFAAFNHFVN